ncbi:Smr/MutS family protein [Marilutibacter chinensis]|nr:Smr/MutS family protein [Lysobacter chinensis]
MPSTPPGADDAALFRQAIGPVRELKASPPAPAAPKPKPRARMAELDESDARQAFRRGHDTPPLESGDLLAYRRDSVSVRSWQRLRRGEISAQEELDLHGADARTAEALLRAFISDAHRHGLGCVRVIHGKGLHGDGAPVLKNLVDRLLRHRADVIAFHSAPPAQGGAGAVLVLLAPTRRR